MKKWLSGFVIAILSVPIMASAQATSISIWHDVKGGRWSVISTPAAGSQATATKAGAQAVRHVADCVSFSGGATAAPVATALQINLRDGATGAGTILWTVTVVAPATTGTTIPTYSVCGLNLVGTVSTAMTIEFSSLLANLSESVTLTGYDFVAGP